MEWDYLFFVLGKFGFGETFISWVRLLYASPQAMVRTNFTNSDYFRLYRSTRQGCPLSPLLFAIVMEPLSRSLQSHPSIHGIVRYGVEQKVALYADDLLLLLSDLSQSVPAALSVLEKFSKFSGYKLNLSKSEMLVVNGQLDSNSTLLPSLPFKVVDSGFTYLGVYVTKKLSDLYGRNFLSLLSKIKQDLERWALLNLSIPARINTIKMNVLPRFLY